MKNLRDTLFCIVFAALVIVIIAQHCAIKAPSRPVSGQTIPSAIEIQQMLKDTGKKRYDPGIVDGIIGTVSQKAWNNYTCDQFANKEFE